ncbi:MAG: MFS transporter [Oceanospirillaceae bacterium]|nr:MFS transporter [Oceanospirillaceae bacterium]MCP5334171.1 MFS transporter [Oceanospirillaceae bacterium]MCP5351471.1 MFS transporter [Oceanospirillaceae bacterium]
MGNLSRFNIFILLSALYFAQGLPFGFFTQAMPVLMREQGMDLRLIGLLSLLALPWALKFLWAPFLDRYSFKTGFHRRGWILLANLAAVTGLLILSMLPIAQWLQMSVLALFGLLLLMNFFAASQDISTDALAVEVVKPEWRGIANGIQVAGYRVGMVVGGGLILGWLPVLGWQVALWCMAAILLFSSLPVLLMVREQPVVAVSYRESIGGFFKRPAIIQWLLILIVYKTADAFGTSMLRPMLVDSGMTQAEMAWLLGTWGVFAGLSGALLGGFLMLRLSRFNALWSFALLQALCIGAYALVTQSPDSPLLWVICLAEHFSGGMATAALFTLMMDNCRPHQAGFDFSFQASVVIIANLLAGAVSGFSALLLGYSGHFVVTLVLGLAVVACVYGLRQRIEEGVQHGISA